MSTLEQLAQSVADLDRRMGELEQGGASRGDVTVETVEAQIEIVGAQVTGTPPPGMSIPEWISSISGSPGIVVDPGKARSTPCIRMELGEGRKALVYSPGIVGALDEEQQALYCQEGYEERPITPKQRERLEAMGTAAKLCSLESTESPDASRLIDDYFACLGRELKAVGQETW